MKKNILLFVIISLLSACGTQKNIDKDLNLKLDENKSLVNISQEMQKGKKQLENLWITWEQMKILLSEQKKWLEKISDLKWDDRKKYVVEKYVLPQLLEDDSITPSFCKTKDLNLYLKCLNKKNIDIDKVLWKVPKKVQDYIEKEYYYQKYLSNKRNLLKKTDNKIAILEKKEVLKELVEMWIFRKQDVCNKIPEEAVVSYCKNLFK